MSKETKVKFALFCAKDCFHLNNKKPKSKAETCIKLVELWLISNEEKRKSLEPKLTKAAYSAYSASASAAYSAASAYSAYSADAAADAADAAYSASRAFAYQSGTYNQEIRNQKLQEYTNLAKSLLSTTKFKHTEFSKTILKHDQKIESIMVLLDHLSEQNEDIIIQTENGVKLNLPSGWDVETRTYDELVNKIINSPTLIEYLKHLYT